MPRAKKPKQETKSGLLSIRSAGRPFVRAREEREKGAPVVLDYTDPRTGKRVKETVQPQIIVRDGRDRLDAARVELAQKAADDRSAELRLNRERQIAEPLRLTTKAAFDRYFDPANGGMPRKGGKADGPLLKHSSTYYTSHDRARRFWLRELGADAVWNRHTPADIDAAAARGKEEHGTEAVAQFVERLSIVANWLRDKADLEVKNPARAFDATAFRGGATPRRPRFTEEELEKLIRHSRAADPRFRLLFCFADSSGSRGGQIREAWRSALDAPLAVTPRPEDAPFGWIAFGGVKGQAAHLVFLTDFQRAEIGGAIGGYYDEDAGKWKPGHLSEFEGRYLATGQDYPLVPGGYTRRGMCPANDRFGRPRTDVQPTVRKSLLNWLEKAERVAGVEHVKGRGMHGVRRAWAKYMRRVIGKGAATHAGGWSKEETMEEIYAGERHEDLAAAREAQQARRRS